MANKSWVNIGVEKFGWSISKFNDLCENACKTRRYITFDEFEKRFCNR